MSKKSLETYRESKDLYERYLDKDNLKKWISLKDGIIYRV